MSVLEGMTLPALSFELIIKSFLLLALVMSLMWFMRRSARTAPALLLRQGITRRGCGRPGVAGN